MNHKWTALTFGTPGVPTVDAELGEGGGGDRSGPMELIDVDYIIRVQVPLVADLHKPGSFKPGLGTGAAPEYAMTKNVKKGIKACIISSAWITLASSSKARHMRHGPDILTPPPRAPRPLLNPGTNHCCTAVQDQGQAAS